MSQDELKEELMFDLTEELNIDENFNPKLLEKKVLGAIKEVNTARKYPKSYDEDRINSDLEGYYSQIRSIALYDYNMIGVEGQTSSNENGVSRVYVNRNSLFNGVKPIARLY